MRADGLRRLMAALCGARALADPEGLSRLLCVLRLALKPARAVSSGLRGFMAALCGARALADPEGLSRLLRVLRLALRPARAVSGGLRRFMVALCGAQTVKCLTAAAACLLSGSLSWAALPELNALPGPIADLEYVDGAPFSLEPLRGQPLVLYFGADWCGPCLRVRPKVDRVLAQYSALGVRSVFVSNDDNRFRADKQREAQLSRRKMAMPTLEKCPANACERGIRQLGPFGQIQGIPSAIVLDAQGRVRAKLLGDVEIAQNLEGSIQKALAVR